MYQRSNPHDRAYQQPSPSRDRESRLHERAKRENQRYLASKVIPNDWNDAFKYKHPKRSQVTNKSNPLDHNSAITSPQVTSAVTRNEGTPTAFSLDNSVPLNAATETRDRVSSSASFLPLQSALAKASIRMYEWLGPRDQRVADGGDNVTVAIFEDDHHHQDIAATGRRGRAVSNASDNGSATPQFTSLTHPQALYARYSLGSSQNDTSSKQSSQYYLAVYREGSKGDIETLFSCIAVNASFTFTVSHTGSSHIALVADDDSGAHSSIHSFVPYGSDFTSTAQSVMKKQRTHPTGNSHDNHSQTSHQDMRVWALHFKDEKDVMTLSQTVALIKHASSQDDRSSILQDLVIATSTPLTAIPANVQDHVRIKYTVHALHPQHPRKLGSVLVRMPATKAVIGSGTLPSLVDTGLVGMRRRSLRCIIGMAPNEVSDWGPHVPVDEPVYVEITLLQIRGQNNDDDDTNPPTHHPSSGSNTAAPLPSKDSEAIVPHPGTRGDETMHRESTSSGTQEVKVEVGEASGEGESQTRTRRKKRGKGNPDDEDFFATAPTTVDMLRGAVETAKAETGNNIKDLHTRGEGSKRESMGRMKEEARYKENEEETESETQGETYDETMGRKKDGRPSMLGEDDRSVQAKDTSSPSPYNPPSDTSTPLSSSSGVSSPSVSVAERMKRLANAQGVTLAVPESPSVKPLHSRPLPHSDTPSLLTPSMLTQVPEHSLLSTHTPQPSMPHPTQFSYPSSSSASSSATSPSSSSSSSSSSSVSLSHPPQHYHHSFVAPNMLSSTTVPSPTTAHHPPSFQGYYNVTLPHPSSQSQPITSPMSASSSSLPPNVASLDIRHVLSSLGLNDLYNAFAAEALFTVLDVSRLDDNELRSVVPQLGLRKKLKHFITDLGNGVVHLTHPTNPQSGLSQGRSLISDDSQGKGKGEQDGNSNLEYERGRKEMAVQAKARIDAIKAQANTRFEELTTQLASSVAEVDELRTKINEMRLREERSQSDIALAEQRALESNDALRQALEEVARLKGQVESAQRDNARLKELSRSYVEKNREERKEEKKVLVKQVLEDAYASLSGKIDPNDVTDGAHVMRTFKDSLKAVAKKYQAV